MITCPSCHRVYHHGVFPLHCSCGTFSTDKEPKYNHWVSLHKYAVDNANNWDTEAAKAWFDLWCDGIPEYSCNCKEKWLLIVESRPPVFNDPRSFFKWAWARHNDVSATIGKPPITFEQAVELYTNLEPERKP